MVTAHRRGRAESSKLARRTGLIAAGLIAAGSLAGSAVGSAEPIRHDDGPPIECGGYAADGQLLRPLAATIDSASLDAAGRTVIPGTCGGYTADGEFIGDD